MLSTIQIKHPYTLEETLSIMRTLEIEAVHNPVFRARVHNLFCQYYMSIDATIKKVWEYVSTNFMYKDSEADEDIISPKYLLDIKAGDCDNFSLFIKSALKVLGIESNYILFGKDFSGFTHIAVYCNGKILDGTNDRFNYVSNEYINRVVI